jgi:hypothetical protein
VMCRSREASATYHRVAQGQDVELRRLRDYSRWLFCHRPCVDSDISVSDFKGISGDGCVMRNSARDADLADLAG